MLPKLRYFARTPMTSGSGRLEGFDAARFEFCPCCGSQNITEPGEFEICDVCGWEDDPVQAAAPDYRGGANRTSLNEARSELVKRRTPDE